MCICLISVSALHTSRPTECYIHIMNAERLLVGKVGKAGEITL